MKTIQQAQRQKAQRDKVGESDHSSRSGFTLLEVLIATALFGLVVAGTIEIYIMCNKIWHSTSLSMQTARESSLALSRVIYGMETNSGLRAAAMVTLNTNVHGHPYPFPDAYKYWETGANPPAAGNAAYYACTGTASGSYSPDGSWRLIVSNNYGGVNYIDYNIKARNILFLPAPNSIANRLLICNYVSAARVTTNASGTVGIQLTVWKKDGMFVSSNTVNTSVKMRNKP